MEVPLPKDKLRSQPLTATRVILVATGSFNPPTYMHLRMFELAKDYLLSNGYSVLGGYMSPVNDHYAKQALAQAEHRIKLCQLATLDSPYIMVDQWEARQATSQRTGDILHRVKVSIGNDSGMPNECPVQVMLLCGADLLGSFQTPNLWLPNQVEEICKDYGIVCISRRGTDVENIISSNAILSKYRKNILTVNETIINDISSTAIRANISRGLSVKYLTSDAVINYIKTHHLYGYKALLEE